MTTEYSQHTILRYNQAISSIRRLYEDHTSKKFQNPVTFKTDFNLIAQILREKYNKASIINMVSAVLWAVHALDKTDDNRQLLDEIITIYRQFGAELKAEIERSKIGKEFELTEKEQKSFMIWEDILSIYSEFKKIIQYNDYNSFLDFVIMSLYILHPPVRADYAHMKVFIDDSFISPNIKENYCVLQTNPRFVFQQYKNAKYKGITVVSICDELHHILIQWMDINTTDYLLASYITSTHSFRVMTENALSKRIPVIFSKHGGKPVTVNTLRHSFISFMSKNDQPSTNKQTNADKMMHTSHMADAYRRMVYT